MLNVRGRKVTVPHHYAVRTSNSPLRNLLWDPEISGDLQDIHMHTLTTSPNFSYIASWGIHSLVSIRLFRM